MSRPWQEMKCWYRISYTLPVNSGTKPEIVALQADSEEEAKRRVVEHYTRKCRGIYGVPTIEHVIAFESWEAVKEWVRGVR